MVGHILAAFALFLAHFILPCAAQVHGFQWKFGNNFILTELQECQTLPIIVQSITNDTSAVGVPPYYVVAFEPGGVPTTQNVGNSSGNLSWLVDHAAGVTLMLTMIDSNGSTGGIPINFYNVTTGGTNTCHPTPNRANLATVTPNVTDHLTTCDPWGLTISGGTKPYTVVLSALNSPVITNVTMGPNDDVFTFPDRADPNTELMASVVDASGQWGVSSLTVHTQGKNDTSCIGRVSSSKTTAQIAAEKAAREAAAKAAAARHRRNLIIEIVLGTTIPILLIAIAAAAYWRRRKLLNDRDRGIWDGQDTIARAFNPPVVVSAEDHTNEMREVGSIGSPSVSDSKLSPYGTSNNQSSLPLLQSDPLTPTSADAGWTSLSSRPSYSSAGAVSSSRTGDSAARTRKALEARMESARQRGNPSHQTSNPSLRSLPSPQRNHPGLPPGALPPLTPGGLSPGGVSVVPLDPDVQPDIIIQHRDGGGSTVVQELPPPYADRGQRRQRDPPRLPPPPQ